MLATPQAARSRGGKDLATFTVTSLSDVTDATDGVLTLREAAALANATAGADTIEFDTGGGGAIKGGGLLRLVSGQIQLTDDVTVNGFGNVTITGDRSGNDVLVPETSLTDMSVGQGALLTDNAQIFGSTGASTDVALVGLTLTGGYSRNGKDGGAVRSEGRLTLVDMTISGNGVSGVGGHGGGVYSAGRVEVVNTQVTGNDADRGSGGGIFAKSGVYTLGSEISENTAAGLGGGIFARGDTKIVASSVSHNETQNNAGRGGGVYIGFNTQNVVLNSTISHNKTNGSFADGAGIFHKSRLDIFSSTITGNSTVGANAEGAGVYTFVNALTLVHNSIITGNTTNFDGLGDDEISGAYAKFGGNILGATVFDQRTAVGTTTASEIFAVTERVVLGTGATTLVRAGSLGENGGPTQTIALRTDGTATGLADLRFFPVDSGDIDADGDTSELILTDGRGAPRSETPAPDLGAFEVLLSSGTDDADAFEGTEFAETFDGKNGIDEVRYVNSSTGVVVDLEAAGVGGDATGDILRSIENLTGSAFGDRLIGNDTANTLVGLAGDDTLIAGIGADLMDGGIGNDLFFVDNAGDVVIEAAGEGTDLVSTSVDFTLPDNVENGSILGTGDVAITGNALANFITGNAGANHLRGEGGADRLIAGLGDDTLEGGAGDDILQGQGGADRFVMTASNGNDQILDWEASTDVLDFSDLGLRFADLRITSSGNEALISFDDPVGGTGSVRLVDIDPEVLEIGIVADPGGVGSPGGIPLTAGTSGADNLAATNGDDDVVGLAGNDILNGRAGADTMLGGFGNDRYFLDQAGDQVIELEFQGADQMDAGFSFTLSDNVERGAVLGGGAVDITGNALGNFITGSALSNVLRGEDGRDRLIAFAGEDTLIGGLDNDVLEGGLGADLFVFEADSGIDLITDFEVGVDLIDVTALGSAFADLTIIDGALGARVIFDLAPGSVDLVTVQGVAAEDLRLASFVTLFGENQPPIVGTQGNDLLFGTVEDDELQGLGGADQVDGRAGADLMIGGLGDDRYFVDNAGDVVVELPGEGTDQITTEISFTLPDNVEDASAFGSTSITLTGNALANFLVAGVGFGDTLDGGAGDDNLLGTEGDDVIIGGPGDDLLRGGDDLGFFLDRFIFATGDGNDQILDFEVGLDLIDLSATGLSFADLTITDTGPNATITYGTDTITVFNTTAAQLDQDQFDFES